MVSNFGFSWKTHSERFTTIVETATAQHSEMYNEAFAAEKPFPEDVVTLPLYFDYIDADSENAIATNDEQHYAFAGITLPLVFEISDVCPALSRSTKITTALPLRVADEPYNALQGMLFYILLSFVVGHEWAHIGMDTFLNKRPQKRSFKKLLIAISPGT